MEDHKGKSEAHNHFRWCHLQSFSHPNNDEQKQKPVGNRGNWQSLSLSNNKTETTTRKDRKINYGQVLLLAPPWFKPCAPCRNKKPVFKQITVRINPWDSAVCTPRQNILLSCPNQLFHSDSIFRILRGDRHWPRGSRRSLGGPVVPLKILVPEMETEAHWAGSGSEDLARQSHTLPATQTASCAGWSGMKRKWRRWKKHEPEFKAYHTESYSNCRLENALKCIITSLQLK